MFRKVYHSKISAVAKFRISSGRGDEWSCQDSPDATLEWSNLHLPVRNWHRLPVLQIIEVFQERKCTQSKYIAIHKEDFDYYKEQVLDILNARHCSNVEPYNQRTGRHFKKTCHFQILHCTGDMDQIRHDWPSTVWLILGCYYPTHIYAPADSRFWDGEGCSGSPSHAPFILTKGNPPLTGQYVRYYVAMKNGREERSSFFYSSWAIKNLHNLDFARDSMMGVSGQTVCAIFRCEYSAAVSGVHGERKE